LVEAIFADLKELEPEGFTYKLFGLRTPRVSCGDVGSVTYPKTDRAYAQCHLKGRVSHLKGRVSR